MRLVIVAVGQRVPDWAQTAWDDYAKRFPHELKVELKTVKQLLPIHEAQLLSYLKLSGHRVGLLLNFQVLHMKDGIKRMVNKL